MHVAHELRRVFTEGILVLHTQMNIWWHHSTMISRQYVHAVALYATYYWYVAGSDGFYS